MSPWQPYKVVQCWLKAVTHFITVQGSLSVTYSGSAVMGPRCPWKNTTQHSTMSSRTQVLPFYDLAPLFYENKSHGQMLFILLHEQKQCSNATKM